MAKVDINIIKEWFRNLKKPNQEQFWSWLDSFRHKDDKIPMADVENLSQTLIKKADLVNGLVPESQLPFTINSNEIIAIGLIETTINNVKINVHESGSNKVRINGQIITRSFANNLPFTPVTTGNKFLRIVARAETGLFFLLEGSESEEPQEPALQPGDVHVRLILVTPTGSEIDPEVLSGFVEKEEEKWKTVTLKSASNFNLQYSDKGTRFRIRSLIDIPKILDSIVFQEETNRAVEFFIYNETNLNISIPNSATNGLSKGFTTAQPPFIILPKTYEKLKYNPETNIIECWKVNSTSGGISTVTTDSTLKGKGSPTEPLGISDAKNAEIAGKATQTQLETKQDKSLFSALVDKMVHFYDSATAKMLSTGVEFVSAGILKLKSIILTTNSGTALPNELGTDGTNVVFGASKKKLAFKDEIFEHNVRGKVIESTGVTGTYNCDLNAATSWILTLTGNTTIDFTNMILADETITISMNVTGNFTLTFPSWLKLSPYADLYDGTKINRIVIEIGKGGSTPSGWYNRIRFDSNA